MTLEIVTMRVKMFIVFPFLCIYLSKHNPLTFCKRHAVCTLKNFEGGLVIVYRTLLQNIQIFVNLKNFSDFRFWAVSITKPYLDHYDHQTPNHSNGYKPTKDISYFPHWQLPQQLWFKRFVGFSGVSSKIIGVSESF